jgi:hypothetical protein
MKKALLLLLLCIVSVLYANAQDIDIVKGKESEVDVKKASFDIITKQKGKLILIEKNKDKNREEFYLHSYDANNEYELLTRKKIDLGARQLNGLIDIGLIEVINDDIYIIIINKSKDEDKKKYFGNSYNFNLEEKGDWKELLNFKLPVANYGEINSFSDWQSVMYSKQEEVFGINDASNPKIGVGYFGETKYFDLSFEEVEFENDGNAVSLLRNKKDDIDKDYPHYLFGEAKYQNEKIIHFFVNSNIEGRDPQKGAKHSVNFAITNAERNIKYGYGRIAELPTGFNAKLIDGYYDSINNTFMILVFYNEKKAKKNEYSGVYTIKYDVGNDDLISEAYTPFSKESKKNFRASKIWKEMEFLTQHNYYYSFDIQPIDNSGYRVVGKFVYNASWSTKGVGTGGYRVVDNKNILGDLVYFEVDSAGKITNEDIINKYFENSTALNANENRKIFSYLSFSTSEGYAMVFLDSKKSYKNGVYNGKVKTSKPDKKACLAIYKTTANGKFERKTLITSLVDELGVIPQANCVYKESDNKYIWFSFYKGTARVITLSVN